MTVHELKLQMERVPEQAQVVIYADLEAEMTCPFPELREKAYVCGYFPLEEAGYEGGELVLTAGGSPVF